MGYEIGMGAVGVSMSVVGETMGDVVVYALKSREQRRELK